MMRTITSVKTMQTFSNEARNQSRTIVLVPTMGSLHQGHVSLMEEGSRRGDLLVVSIFVNPTQFGRGEDYQDYPRDLERDQEVAQKAGAEVVFAPQVSEMYPPEYQTFVNVEGITRNLCGITRPTHFRGVTTVVCKLFNIVKPHAAVFGEKDFQQLVTIRKMVADLNLDVEIVGMPIYREEDGLAISSRNRYLTPPERKAALCLFGSLQKASKLFAQGERETKVIIREVRKVLEAEKLTQIEYVKVCDTERLEDREDIDQEVVLALAVKIGNARLIDNVVLNPYQTE